MSDKIESWIERMRFRLEAGVSTKEVATELRAGGLTPIQAIKVLREAASISLGEAKKIVDSHPAWADVIRAAEPLHEELEEILRPRE